jgi:hypothetical protein
MSFSVEIQIVQRYGLECYRAEVELVCLGPGRPTNPTPFLFDTGADVTTVSEDVAPLEAARERATGRRNGFGE